METILEVEDLSYAYDNRQMALKNINVKIHKGEKIAVLGANGAGKSTFFLNLNGVLHPEHGSIRYRNEKMTQKNVNLFRKNIGIVFQDADNQIIAATVQAEVSFGPMNLKLSKEEVVRRVDSALHDMNLSDFRERPPHYLSGGEKKRVSIAGILAMEPEIVIFDEPTAALDPVNAEMLEQVLAQLHQEQKTLLVSTHDVDFAYQFADRVIVFYEGEIIADGTPLSVFEEEEILKKANLKKPMLLEVVYSLQKSGKFDCFDGRTPYPKSIKEFQNIIGNTL